MRIVSFMIVSIAFVFLLSACNDTAKVDELTKANSALSAELQECKTSQKKSALLEEENKKEAEAVKRVRNEIKNSKKTQF